MIIKYIYQKTIKEVGGGVLYKYELQDTPYQEKAVKIEGEKIMI